MTKTDKPFLGLRTAIFRVEDLEAAKDWYAKVLGIQPYFDEPFYVGFEVAGYELGLQPIDKRTGPLEVTSYPFWGVDDVQEEYQRLLDLGAESFEEPQNVGGEIVVAVVKDPWGNPFGMIYNPHFSL